MKSKKKIEREKRGGSSRAAHGSAGELAKRIASEILTVSASGGPVRCTRAVMMKGKYPDGERDMGGRNAASIAFVVKEHLIAGSPRYVVQSEHPRHERRVWWVMEQQNHKQVSSDTYNRSTAERWCKKLNAENSD